MAQTLPAAVQEVVHAHPDVLTQQASLRGVVQEESIARQQFFPTPSVSLERAQAGSADFQYQGDSQVTVLRLQQPLWTGGRLTAGLGKAEAAVRVRQAALEETRQQLALSTVESWGAWCSAEARLAAISRSLDLHRELQGKVQRRVEEGASAPTELTMTEGRVAQVAAQRSAQQAQRQVARSRLAQLLGKPLDMPACPTWPVLGRLDFSDIDQVTSLAQASSPSLLRLGAQIEQVRQEVDERKADLWPEVFVRAEHQRGNYNIAHAPSTNRVFVGVSSRLGAGLSTVKQVESMVQRQQAAEQELEGGRRKTAEQVQGLWIQLQDVQARLPALAQQAKATQSTLEAWDRQFLAGRKSWLDVMNAAREAMQAELDLADAQESEKSLQWRLAVLVQGVDAVLSMAPAEPR